jgi:hypothetical protein
MGVNVEGAPERAFSHCGKDQYNSCDQYIESTYHVQKRVRIVLILRLPNIPFG